MTMTVASGLANSYPDQDPGRRGVGRASAWAGRGSCVADSEDLARRHRVRPPDQDRRRDLVPCAYGGLFVLALAAIAPDCGDRLLDELYIAWARFNFDALTSMGHAREGAREFLSHTHKMLNDTHTDLSNTLAERLKKIMPAGPDLN
jgi:hypothetical protein